MKDETFLTAGNTVLLALAKGVCPICSLLRAFQKELIERLQPTAASAICNFHAWAIATSAPASSAAEIFLAMLRGTSSGDVWKERIDCNLCWSIREHETASYGSLLMRCGAADFPNGWSSMERSAASTEFFLQSVVNEEDARIIAKVIKNNQRQLGELLDSFAAGMRSGQQSGSGLLGRAAEFLVAQRGLTR